MKFGNYIVKSGTITNVGDIMMIVAMNYIYGEMGIKKEEICYIHIEDLSTYQGEYICMPVFIPLLNYHENGIAGMFSSRIIPVFISYTTPAIALEPIEVQYLKQYAPIGCRDEHTFQLLRRYGIQAYMNGCITALFPRRVQPEKAITFIVDAEPELMAVIPDEIKKEAIVLSHLVSGQISDTLGEATKFYQRYRNEAAMVITARLHCAVPCAAMGIPVVFAKNRISHRFAWVNKLIPIYDQSQYNVIPWFDPPIPIEYEEQKKKILDFIIKKIQLHYERYAETYYISSFYEDRDKLNYIVDGYTDIKDFLSDRWPQDVAFTYGIWGMTEFANTIYYLMKENYPNTILSHVYDLRSEVAFHGINSQNPNHIGQNKEEFLFVCCNTSEARRKMVDLLQVMQKKPETYWVLKADVT